MPPSPDPRPLAYTFGNHMHWVDMQWLWGEGVLPGCTADMLRFCAEAGVRGNVNFDAIGYEKMAAECPEALADLRRAIEAGTIEPVGCSWGQPYGLFQGAESNIRQFSYGHRAVRRLLGVRPRAFWEEEFWFFPQLPQILAGFGYTGACLFFQWTWHTPEVPTEASEIIHWRGLDGTTLPTLPRNGLNLHQWPEDFEPMLESPLLAELAQPALVQWIELMPSPDWMCRAELLLPRMQELAADPRFRLEPHTLSSLIQQLDRADAPVRSYTLDEVWHGLSLGKNADAHPRASLRTERATLEAEALATLTGMLGRPYPSWDVYPHWELDEAWREQLAAQHHDNHECEGLCGFIGHDQFTKAEAMANRISARSGQRIAGALDPADGAAVVTNPLPWTRDLYFAATGEVVREVPGCGYRQATGERAAPASPPGLPELGLEFSLGLEGQRVRLAELAWPTGGLPDASGLRAADPRCRLALEVGPTEPIHRAVALKLRIEHPLADWDPGMNGALAADFLLPELQQLLHDHPFAQTPVEAERSWPRKYPSGDWMTSEQWFETVAHPFTAQRFVLARCGQRDLMIVHDGSQSWQRLPGRGIRVLLNVRDPWDEDFAHDSCAARFWLLDASGWPAWKRHRVAEELLSTSRATPVGRPLGQAACVGGGDPRLGPKLPVQFGALEVDGPLVATAFRRLGPHEGEGLSDWAAKTMQAPHLVRLLECEGQEARGQLRLGLPIARAVRSNLLGETESRGPAPQIVDPQTLAVQLRPHEIQTLVLDLPDAAKQARDLDARRQVWAQIHRHESR